MTQEFKHLFSPIKIGPLTVRNRIVSSAHHPLFINLLTGLLDERMINYWAAKAKGGIGLIETYLTPLMSGRNRIFSAVLGWLIPLGGQPMLCMSMVPS